MGLSLFTPRITLKVSTRRCGIQPLGSSRPSVVGVISDEKTVQYFRGGCELRSAIYIGSRYCSCVAGKRYNASSKTEILLQR
ncbi:hypothetical protein TNCV_3371471 [Trichonephila clavipes]|nr:hypothetical protein TNCV_3371471 [Trichonephila clavipes]